MSRMRKEKAPWGTILSVALGAVLALAGCAGTEPPAKKYATIRKGGKTYQLVPAADILMRREITPPPAPNTEETSIVVGLADQRVWLYKYGQPTLAAATCPGKPGHETPEGTFRVISKHKEWISTLYHVPMPNFMRLNAANGMIGLHEGPIALNPSSHGCIRLPADMAEAFFETTPVGTTVVVTKSPASELSEPWAKPL